jgi:hypothetical protein
MAGFAVIGDPCTLDDVASPSWLSSRLGFEVKSAELQDMSGSGGLSAAMLRLKIVRDSDGSELSYVVKRTKPGEEARSANLGLSREAYFLNDCSGMLPAGLIPQVTYIHGNMSSGEKTIIMEDFPDAIQSGYFFGPGSPHNWGKDLAAITSKAEGVTVEKVIESACEIAAKVHATYWRKPDLASKAWLRGGQWISGGGQTGWEGGQQYAKNAWKATKAKMGTESYTLEWPENIVAIIDASMEKISWDAFQQRVQNDPWTLVHGDFHPANMLWRLKPDESGHHLVLLDWEVVGIGCGAQDIGQYFISHVDPAKRREVEHSAVRRYYDDLIALGVPEADYAWEKCWSDYVAGGIERWIWLIALMSSGFVPEKMMTYFMSQFSEFASDHGVTAENVGMPRY